MIFNGPGNFNAHNREQAEAAFLDAVSILRRHSENFVIYLRTGTGTYCRHVEGKTQVERVAIASGVSSDLNLMVSDIAIVAAKEVDRQAEEDGQTNA